MCEFPLDLLIEILIRLPTNSLMRFKCVSKQWSSLIFCRHFCNSLFTATRQQQPPRLYMCLVDKEFRKRVLLSISSTSLYNTCFVVDQDLSISGMGGFFLGVVRGLMCFSLRENACIYNPSTKQLLTLPAIKPDIKAVECQQKYTRCYIGHDPVSDQYNLFCTITISYGFSNILKSEHWVFVLEAGGSWRKVVPLKYYRPHNPLSIGWSKNGSVVHHMALLGMYTFAIVSFDVRSEELTMFPVPYAVGDAFLMNGVLVEYGGKIAIFDHNNLEDKGFAVLWVLKDVGRDKWSKKKMVLQPCQRHLVGDTKLVVKATTPDGKVILAPSEMRSPFYILCYDMQSNDLRKVEIKGIPQLWFEKECYFDLKFMDENESFVYLET